jgi:hypothetical protein
MRVMIRAAARRAPAVSRTIDVKRQRFSSIRPAIDGTRTSARALFAAAATRPQNLTSGRRASRPHQNSSYPRSLSSIGWNQSLWRHLAARTLCGPPAEFSRDWSSLARRLVYVCCAPRQAAFILAPSGISPWVTQRQSAIRSFRASATIVTRRIRPRS